jgi:hypothetical protein
MDRPIDMFGYAVVGGFATFLGGQMLGIGGSPVLLFAIGILITWLLLAVLLIVRIIAND